MHRRRAPHAHAVHCALQVVPMRFLPSLTKLKHMDLSHNKIEQLPLDIGTLT